MLLRLLPVIVFLAAAPLPWAGPTASADEGTAASRSGTAVLVSDPSKLELSVDGDDATVEITVLNSATSPLNLVGTAVTTGAACAPTGSTVSVDPVREQTVKVAFTGCNSDTKSTALFYLATQEAPTVKLFPPMTAAPKGENATIVWNRLWWFVWCGLGGLLVLIVAWAKWNRRGFERVRPDSDPPVKETVHPGPRFALQGLDSSWTFKESWASNATVIAAAFTGVFGATGVANTILGEDTAKPVLAISAVATAVALALAGTAPMLLQMCRRWDSDNDVTPTGIVLAGTVTIAATGGELAVLMNAVNGTNAAEKWVIGLPFIDQDPPVLTVTLWLGLILLAMYAFTATVQNLVAGQPKPEAPKKPTTIEQIAKNWHDWLAHLKSKMDYEELTSAEQEGIAEPQPPAEGPFVPMYAPESPRRRTAIL